MGESTPDHINVQRLYDGGTLAQSKYDDGLLYRFAEPAAGPLHRDRCIQGSVRTLAEIRERVQYRLIEREHNAMMLHSAAIVHEDRAILFPAHSGAGKTMLAAWCISQAEQVLTDELVAVLPSGSVTAFSQALNVKRHGMPVAESFPGILPVLTSAPGAGLGGRFLPLPAPRVSQPIRPAGVIFLQYTPGQWCSTRRLSQGETLSRLLSSLVNSHNLSRRGLEQANMLAAAVPAYRIRYDNLPSLMRFVHSNF